MCVPTALLSLLPGFSLKRGTPPLCVQPKATPLIKKFLSVFVQRKRQRKTSFERTLYRWWTLEGQVQNGRQMHKERTMNAQRTDDERKQHAHVHRTEGKQRLMYYWIQTVHFRSAVSERRSLRKSCMNTYYLAISRMEMRLNADATESYTTERKRNETECKRNEMVTRRNKRNATRAFFNTNATKRKWNRT